MFNSLKQKLSGFKDSFGSILEKEAKKTSEEIEKQKLGEEIKKETQAQTSVRIGQKAKTLLLNREFIIDEKSLEDPL